MKCPYCHNTDITQYGKHYYCPWCGRPMPQPVPDGEPTEREVREFKRVLEKERER